MNGQYLCNRQITVSYAYKKDTKGERHGTPAGMFLASPKVCFLHTMEWVLIMKIFGSYHSMNSEMMFLCVISQCAERILASSNPAAQRNRPHTLFASGPPTLPNGPRANGAAGTPIPPRPFANGAVPPSQMPPVRPPPPMGQFPPPMQLAGPPSWPGQPQPSNHPMPPPPPFQQFRPPMQPPPPVMQPPPPTGMARPPPPPSGVAVPPPGMWRPPPPPQQVQIGARPMPMLQMSMPPPPPPNAPLQAAPAALNFTG